jgi:hypothetical protein
MTLESRIEYIWSVSSHLLWEEGMVDGLANLYPIACYAGDVYFGSNERIHVEQILIIMHELKLGNK